MSGMVTGTEAAPPRKQAVARITEPEATDISRLAGMEDAFLPPARACSLVRRRAVCPSAGAPKGEGVGKGSPSSARLLEQAETRGCCGIPCGIPCNQALAQGLRVGGK